MKASRTFAVLVALAAGCSSSSGSNEAKVISDDAVVEGKTAEQRKKDLADQEDMARDAMKRADPDGER